MNEHPKPTPLDATAGAALVVDALARAGITDVVIAPGSRSTPLVAAVAGHPKLRTLIVHDERSGAFVALGLSRALGRPAVLVTTSGTAVANAMPAVVEADVDRVPLIVLTADRPPESQGTDANQTIDQADFFGCRVRASLQIPPPEDTTDLPALRAALAATLHASLGDLHSLPRGPVHLNAAFRKPLEPVYESRPTRFSNTEITVIKRVPPESLSPLLEALAAAKRPLVVVGAAADDADRAGLAAAAAALGRQGFSILACALSGLRGRGLPGVLRHGPLLAKAGQLPSEPPDLLLWLGGAAVAPEFGVLAGRAPSLWRIDDRARRPLEFGHAQVLRTAPERLAEAAIPARCADPLRRRDQLTVIPPSKGAPTEISTAALAAEAARSIGATLFIGNSMPVRDVDLFAGSALPPRVVANRGASGIDGLLSTAAGVARAVGPTLLLVGDVSFLHDAGSLSALVRAQVPLRIVVIDNRGGGIFDFLPIAQHPELMAYFTTPHTVDLVALAAAYGVPARRIDDTGMLVEACGAPIDRLEVIVVPVAAAGPGNANVAQHRAIYAQLREAAATLDGSAEPPSPAEPDRR